MPTYVYKNLVTGETFEVQQRITEDAYTVHPETGEPVKRIIQPVGIAFKGSGFYVNDSRAGSRGRKAAADSTTKPAGESAAASSAATPTQASSTASGSSGGSTPG